MLEDQFSTFVYIKQNDEFVIGEVIDIGDGILTVEILNKGNSNTLVDVAYGEAYPTETYHEKDVDDLCSLIYLNEVTLLKNCNWRYKRNVIYTYLASILVSINPYEDILDLYSLDNVRKYKNKSLGILPPHIFAIADKAHRDMKRFKCSQSIVISGESGAGKTESQKHILRFYCENFGTLGIIEQRILEANPILEAFGNAKTIRNNNSSRFGKFVELHFNSKFEVCGGFVEHYLLEKSRLVSTNSKERNYHVFYYLLAAADSLEGLYITGGVENFQYLKNGDTLRNDDILVFKNQFEHLNCALERIGLNIDQINGLFQILAGLLHLGNVQFVENMIGSREGCEISNASEASLDYASELLGLDADELSIQLTTRVMTTTKGGNVGTVYAIDLKSNEAENSKNSLAKAIYSRVFDWIIAAINRSIPFGDSSNYIGILDIAGFEYFESNSFEQFSINYANEKLQHFFNERILKSEQQIYQDDGLIFEHVSFTDNLDCIELFESSNGLLNILDEECRLPKPTYNHFTETVHGRLKDHPRLLVPRKALRREDRNIRDSDGFVVKHYADEVTYQSAQFLEKNQDTLHESLLDLMKQTKNNILKAIFDYDESNVASKPGATSLFKSRSVSHKFRSQLNLLLKKLSDTQTHFVRCFKPNQAQVSNDFDEMFVLKQLKAAGIPSTMSLMQAGYPSRLVFNELYEKYKPFIEEIQELNRLDPRNFLHCLLKALGFNENDYKFGLTKLFFRSGKFAKFDELLKNDQESIQAFVDKTRSWLIHMRFKKVVFAVIAAIKIKKLLDEKRRKEEERRLQEELRRQEEEKRRQEEEKRYQEEEERRQEEERRYREEEKRRQKEEEERIQKEEEDRRQEEETRRQALLEEEIRKEAENQQNAPNLLASYKYQQLREIITTSNDLNLVRAARVECYRRMRSYLSWKMKHIAKK